MEHPDERHPALPEPVDPEKTKTITNETQGEEALLAADGSISISISGSVRMVKRLERVVPGLAAPISIDSRRTSEAL